MVKDCRLTTVDNPYNPFEQFTSWYLFDVENGYNTCSKLDRLLNVSEDMSQDEIDEEAERVIDEIIANDFLNIYKKITKAEEETEEPETMTV